LKKAEVALKGSKAKDYYKILGVHKECTEVEIKKADGKESLKHHPDKVRVY
jgi:DnaJ family protein C protein 7